MNNIKRILIIALCSILCVCTVPRFSLYSEAASISTYALYETLLSLSGYLASRGYSIFHNLELNDIPSVSELRSWTVSEQENLLYDFAAELNSYGTTVGSPGLGDEILRAFRLIGIRGYLELTQSARENFDNWIYGNTTSGSVSISNISTPITDFVNDALYPYHLTPGLDDSLILSVPSIPLFEYYGFGNSGHLYILPESLSDWTFNAAANRYDYPVVSSDHYLQYVNVSYDGKTYYCPYFSAPYQPWPYDFSYVPLPDTSTVNLANVFSIYYGGSIETVDSGSVGTTQITDTSGTELLTSTNTIDSDGTVSGATTIYLPDQSTLETAIDGYNQGSITYEDFLKIFGINSVASDATVQEKEDALTVVVTPTEDYQWFTKTQWGADTIEETRKASASTRAEEDSLADSIANTANGGSDPEDPDNKSRGKGLLALLLIGLGIWNTPIIAGNGTPSGGGTDDGSSDDGSGDTSGYLAESIAGMAVAGSLVDDLFDSAGGSDGYGLIYTVGASFVIFSVIIGAANYFGALFHGSDTKQNIKASGKKSNPGKEKKGG